jgi:hypothetical protein
MAVQIDNFDSEIEIMPSAPVQRQPASGAAGTASTGTTIAGRELRHVIAQTLDEELQAYLRTRG